MSRQNSPKLEKGKGTPKTASPLQTILKFSQNASVFVEQMSPLAPSSPYYQIEEEDDEMQQDDVPTEVQRDIPPLPQTPTLHMQQQQQQYGVPPLPLRTPQQEYTHQQANLIHQQGNPFVGAPQHDITVQQNQVLSVPIQPELSPAAVPVISPNHKPRAKYFLGHGWVPFFASLIWLSCIAALLIIWLAEGQPRYPWGGNTIAYISDVGAANKGLFVALSVVTAILFITTLALDRALRKHSRLPGFWRRRENVFSICSTIFGTIGVVALVLLSILDDRDYGGAHWAFTLIFIVSIFINAIFNSLEIGLLSRHYPLARRLRSSAKVKIGAISIGIAFAIIMVGLMASCSGGRGVDLNAACNTADSAAAVFEWSIALIFVVYIGTYIWDLRILDDPVINPSPAPANAPITNPNDMEMGVVKNHHVIPPTQHIPIAVEGSSAA